MSNYLGVTNSTVFDLGDLQIKKKNLEDSKHSPCELSQYSSLYFSFAEKLVDNCLSPKDIM